MKQKIYIILIAVVAFVINLHAEEELLGQYHFNDAVNYSEVGTADAIMMNATEAIAQWTISINTEGNGVYKAVNVANRNFNQFPMAVSIQPKPGYVIKITKIEISHKTVTTGAGPTQKFSYYVGASQTVASATDISDVFTLQSAAEFTTLTLTPASPIEINENKMWFYNRIHSNSSNQFATTEVDFIKFYGTYLDPNAPVINVPTAEQNIKGTPIGANASRVIDISHKNLVDIITTSSSKANFKAEFDDAEDGTYQKLRVTFQPVVEGYDTANITLTSEATTATISIKGWGLPENTLAAWSFEDQTTIPDYHANPVDTAKISLFGNAGAVFFFRDSWTYEVSNLYTKIEETEVPEISGIKFSNLGFSGPVTLRFDIQARNGSPNTMKVGTFDESSSSWLSGVYWRNPRETLGLETVTLNCDITDGVFNIVSAFDQTIEPKAFKQIKSDVAFNNTSGWAFDNIVIIPQFPQSVNNPEQKNTRVYSQSGLLFLKDLYEDAKLDIISTSGKLIQSERIRGNSSVPVNLKGIYLVRIISEQNTYVQKVIF